MKLCLALDLSSKEENLVLLQSLKDFPLWVKVGLRSFIRDGKEFLQDIKAINADFKIFLDLKLYDIPNTMKTAVQECKKLQVDMLTIHASSGLEAMRECTEASKDSSMLIFAVTALTSFDDSQFLPIYNAHIASQAHKLALLANEAKCHGVVCSTHESLKIKKQTSLLTLTPAIRLCTQESQDQKRVATPKDAKEAKADFIVVGRPIYQASNPREVTQNILEQIQ